MKKTWLVVFAFLFPYFSPAQYLETLPLNHSSSNYIFKKSNFNRSSQLDSSLNQIQIYDPAASDNYFGLGFPGAASRSLILITSNEISISPLFNSFNPLLFGTKFRSNLNTPKPFTQIEYVIFPSIKTEQYLNLLHVRNINRNINLGLQLRKIKSNGYYLNQGSNSSNFLAFFDLKSPNQRYRLYSNFVYNGLVTLENGGVEEDEIDYGSTSLSLQSLPVKIEAAKNRVTLYGGSVVQYFNFGITEYVQIDSSTQKRLFHPTSQISLSLNYKRHTTNFIYDNPNSGFFQNIYEDSVSTNDKFIYDSYTSEISFSTLENEKAQRNRFPIFRTGLFNELSTIDSKESLVQLSNTSAFISLNSPTNSLLRVSVDGQYFLTGYNTQNFQSSFSIGRKFLDSTKREFNVNLILEVLNRRPDYVFQNYASNHFRWKNNFENTFHTNLCLRVSSKQNSVVSIRIIKFENLVFLDSTARPVQLGSNINFFSANIGKLFKMRSFYLNTNLVYQTVIKGPDVFGLPELFTRNSVYWANSVFKKAMDLQIGFDIIYTSKYTGLAYQPALNSFYYQDQKNQGNYPAIDFFLNFKIRQVRGFFKVDHLNYGLSSGKYQYVPDYLLPGRTFRFGLTWLFIN